MRPLLLISLAGALLSIALQGFIVGTGNNAYHLPIMERLYDLPQFADDRYIQSLRSYASVFWALLRDLSNIGGPPSLARISATFFAFHILSRWLSFAGFLLCASLLGIRATRERLVFTLLLATTTMLRGNSSAGAGGLFLEIFTHSEICNGLTLISIYWAMTSRLAWSWSMNGVIFAINFFFAVWNAVPLGVITVFRVLERRVSMRSAILSTMMGVSVFLAIALPVVYWALHNSDAAQPVGFNYIEFLAFFSPDHFLFTHLRPASILKFAVILWSGYLALREVTGDRKIWFAVLNAFVFVYLTGIALPAFTHSKVWLNLHLLRVSGTITLICTLAILSVATRWLFSSEVVRACVWGPVLVFICCSSKVLLLLAPAVFLAPRLLPRRVLDMPQTSALRLTLTRQVALLLTVVFLAGSTWQGYRDLAAERAVLKAWTSLGQWIQNNTPPTSTFLLPYLDPRTGQLPVNPAKLSLTSVDCSFEALSLRRGWVDAKRGAAVMWSSSYYSIWEQRMEEGRDLKTLAQKIPYARTHGIGYIVETCHDEVASGQSPIYRNGIACLYDAKQ